jgi:acylphosphatase
LNAGDADHGQSPPHVTPKPGAVLHARLLIEGRVQGVGYRWFTIRAARELGVRGWVRNLGDGRVEAQVAAPSAAFERLLERLRRGPSSARVDRLEIEPIDEEPGFDGFTVRD